MRRMIKIAIMIFLLAFALTLYASNFFVDTSVNKYSWTKALCEGKTCQDYYIECEGTNVLSTTPVTGLVTFDSNWQDKRNLSQGLCPLR